LFVQRFTRKTLPLDMREFGLEERSLLPLQCRAMMPWLFADVQKYLQIDEFFFWMVVAVRRCSCGLVYNWCK
jgi:hypothetical protein